VLILMPNAIAQLRWSHPREHYDHGDQRASK
jgi:hypothetical protein